MIARTRVRLRRAAAVAAVLAAVAASRGAAASGRSEAPIPDATLALMRAKGLSPAAPILMRTYKKESELEVWKQGRDGRYVLLKTFPICRWSGQLGPKTTLGDRQTPEGFYSIAPAQLNPNSSYYLSFDVGYPNAFDRARGGTGAYLMVHGTCSSAGCFAMTDKGIAEIYAIAREAFAGGQQAFQFQAYPFRMTAENMARHRLDPNVAFWRQLKEGSDRFEATGDELAVGVSGGRYMFGPTRMPDREALVAARRAEEDARTAALARSKPAVRTTYVDGGQHPSFRAQARRGNRALGQVSRPETLAFAGKEIELLPDGSPKPEAPPKPEKAARSAAKGKRTSGPRPMVMPAEASPGPAERSLYERFLGGFRTDGTAAPAPERRL